MGINRFIGEKKHPQTVVLGMLLVIVLLFSGLWLSGCSDDEDLRAYYSKENAVSRAHKRLVTFAQKHHVPLKEFKGPYFIPSTGTDIIDYMVCYKHSLYSFCYQDYSNRTIEMVNREMNPNNSLYKWLEQQSNP